MNHNYAASFLSLRNEFRMYKQAPSTMNAVDERWPSPKLPDAQVIEPVSSTASAPPSLASSILHPSSIFIPSLDPSFAFRTRLRTTEEAVRTTRYSEITSNGFQVTVEDVVSVPSVQMPQRPRKGHLKSRQGCYNCKRRKIKVMSQEHFDTT